MIKQHYLKELSISGTQSKNNAANKKADVMKIQAWLNLFALAQPSNAVSIAVDGDFGPATEKAVKNFQKLKGLPQSGIVNAAVFSKLSEPMQNAFETKGKNAGLRNLVVEIANIHLSNNPYELVIQNKDNSGPWVRAYMDGHEGDAWFWCMGFVQAIVDQACSQLNKDFRALMPLTYSCDTVGSKGLEKKILSRYTTVRNNPSVAKPGDIFLLQKSPFDWTHTGIITAVDTDTFETIEGNTNMGGSRNGNAVLRRVRNFRLSKLDVFSIEPLL
ncbi:MAG: peptidoglycan-binding protein [Chitinophagaceae bacterium]|nr:peptidoglycan-binding protein [Chitinophagaceae bacterium]